MSAVTHGQWRSAEIRVEEHSRGIDDRMQEAPLEFLCSHSGRIGIAGGDGHPCDLNENWMGKAAVGNRRGEGTDRRWSWQFRIDPHRITLMLRPERLLRPITSSELHEVSGVKGRESFSLGFAKSKKSQSTASPLIHIVLEGLDAIEARGDGSRVKAPGCKNRERVRHGVAETGRVLQGSEAAINRMNQTNS